MTNRNFLLVAMLIYAVAMAGCATQRGIVTTQCDRASATLVDSITLKRSINEQTVRFLPTGEGVTCIEIRREPPAVVENIVEGEADRPETMTIRLGAEPTLQAFNGGGYSSELTFPEAAWQNNRISLRKKSDGRADAVRIINPWSGLELEIFHDDLIPPDHSPREVETVTLPAVECTGTLRGFKPLTVFGESPELHPVLPRARVGVYCTAFWLVDAANGGSNLVPLTTGFGLTNDMGEYSVGIQSADVDVFLSSNPPRLISVEPHCLIPQQCGHEARFDFAQRTVNLAIDDVPDAVSVDILDVLDISSQGPAIAGVDGSPGPRLMLGARLISDATSFPERNDRPFIIHEQLDVFNEEFTRFGVWGYSGQPFRSTFVDEDDKTQTVDARTEPCDVDRERQYCVKFTEDCNPNTCNNPDHGCLEYPMLQAMLNAGYDVWFVDHLRGEEDVTHMAAAAPLLYQRILNYGGPSGELNLLPSLDDLKLTSFVHRPETATPELAIAAFEQHTLAAEPPPVPPVPMSGDRRAVVSGFSLGGVVARAGLRLWEIDAILPQQDLVDHKGNPVSLATSTDVFMERPHEKIALYVSFDAPHRGVRIPPSLQAYIKRFEKVVNSFPNVSDADKAQVVRANRELNATPTRQTLMREIEFSTGEPLGCINIGGKSISNCRVQPFTTEIKTRVGGNIGSGFRSRWLDMISNKPPQTLNGLPASIPSVAVSNGNMGGPRQLQYAGFVDLKFDIKSGFDKKHLICDEFSESSHQGLEGIIDTCGVPGEQIAGSQWNNACGRISDAKVGINAEHWDFSGFWSGVGTIFIGSWYVPVFDPGVRGIKVTYPMQPEFDEFGQIKEKTGFPTIVPTSSALMLDERGRPSPLWRDAYWQRRSEYHSNIDNEICRMVLFHADGVFEDDEDGWPACGDNINIPLCENGGRFPGRVLGAQALDPDLAPCDCQPNDDTSYPGANERLGDLIDNDCDGLVDEAEFDQ